MLNEGFNKKVNRVQGVCYNKIKWNQIPISFNSFCLTAFSSSLINSLKSGDFQLGKIISANLNSATIISGKDHLGRYHFGIV
jgi:hypothetical protein